MVQRGQYSPFQAVAQNFGLRCGRRHQQDSYNMSSRHLRMEGLPLYSGWWHQGITSHQNREICWIPWQKNTLNVRCPDYPATSRIQSVKGRRKFHPSFSEWTTETFSSDWTRRLSHLVGSEELSITSVDAGDNGYNWLNFKRPWIVPRGLSSVTTWKCCEDLLYTKGLCAVRIELVSHSATYVRSMFLTSEILVVIQFTNNIPWFQSQAFFYVW